MLYIYDICKYNNLSYALTPYEVPTWMKNVFKFLVLNFVDQRLKYRFCLTFSKSVTCTFPVFGQFLLDLQLLR